MTKSRFLFTTFSIAVVILATSVIASAQATRTWVSGVGDDVNPCSRTAPCKTFAGAISKTAASGEIDCIDPGGFGAVTITKGITIDGGGTFGSILAAGTNGIIINDAAVTPTAVVTIRNISINGAGTGVNGIRILKAKTVHLENVEIFGFTGNGVDTALTAVAADGVTRVFIDDVDVRDLRGVSSIGIKLSTAVDFLVASMHRVHVHRCPTGIQEGANVKSSIRDSILSGASIAGIELVAGTGKSTIENTELFGNVTGLNVGAGATALISQVSITQNGTGISSAGTVQSSGNNRILGNSNDGVVPTIINTK
jgi:hypothetical protein